MTGDPSIPGNKSRAAFDLFLVSALSLYFELVVIRWLSSEIRIFAYFKNLPLMACLFGLGVGLALARSKHNLARWFPASLLVITFIICYSEPLNLIHIAFLDPLEFYLLGLADNPLIVRSFVTMAQGLCFLVAIFYLIVFAFICLGQRLGQLFDSFNPLPAYTINVGASLVGILTFSLFSYLAWKPDAWLLAGCLPLIFLYKGWANRAVIVACLALAFVTTSPRLIWSPYYRISINDWWMGGDGTYPPFKYGTNISVNHDFLEGAFDNRDETLARLSPRQRAETWEHYSTLYKLIGVKPRSVLILASGMGNDVASALRHGATDIDAVEIDPVVVALGRLYHVEKPYDDPRVRVHVDDARAFLKRATRKYDLVDFAYLDSHAAFSSMSSVRLDNYVYTVESFKEAINLLKPDGVIAVHFFASKSWQTTRIIKTLAKALGYEPLGMWSETGRALLLLGGPGLDRKRATDAGLRPFSRTQWQVANMMEMTSWDSIEPSTDDWPFLFLRNRGLTFAYAAGLIVTLLAGYRLITLAFGKSTGDPTGRTMFFLGAAFMLVEVKSMTQMGLLLGTTWLVNSAVIGAILLMILIANLVVLKAKPSRVEPWYAALMVALLVSFLMPLGTLNALPFLTRSVVGALVLAMPLPFAAVIFAITFSRVKEGHSALGMNLLGTLFGGALEYASMILGVNALNIVAAGLYALAYLSWRKGGKASAPLPAEPTAQSG